MEICLTDPSEELSVDDPLTKGSPRLSYFPHLSDSNNISDVSLTKFSLIA